MSNPILKAAILIISETAARDSTSDKATSILQKAFSEHGGDQWEVADSKIVPDNVLDIQRTVMGWTDGPDYVNLIVTSGGTGFAVKDVTPEAVTPLIHKHAPGLVHGMLSASLSVTPFAVMSRPVAGTRNQSLIITLPGSPKGAVENLLAILKLLPHACVQASGADSRQLHVGGVKKLEQDAGLAAGSGVVAAGAVTGNASHHHHDHSHSHTHSHNHDHGSHKVPRPRTDQSINFKSNDPNAGPTRRNRSSPYPMLSVEEALQLISANVPSPKTIDKPVDASLVGHVLAEDVKAPESVPAFRASIVDGYAVIVSPEHPAAKGTYPVAMVSHAQQARGMEPLQPGTIARITTGAPLPPNATAVVMVEDTTLESERSTPTGSEEASVAILTDATVAGENVREIGSDVEAGSTILRKGEGITAAGGELGLLASVGVHSVSVYKKPTVGVLSTGDEIIPHDRKDDLQMGEVRDTNRLTLLTALRSSGFEAVDLGIASDTPGALEASLRAAFQRVDLLITSGGVSMGELDLLKPTIEHTLGGTIHFGRVSMKPGKPTTFATISHLKDATTGERAGTDAAKVIFSLPGNPASAVVTFFLFVLPALHAMSGIAPVGLPKLMVTLDGEVRCDATRAEYHRVVVTSRVDGGLYAVSTGGQRSSRIGSFRGANALLCLPAGGGTLEKGKKVQALLVGGLVGGY